jgi:hypothetical protein
METITLAGSIDRQVLEAGTSTNKQNGSTTQSDFPSHIASPSKIHQRMFQVDDADAFTSTEYERKSGGFP